MSRIGKLPITVPESVKVKINNQTVSIIGPHGELIKEISNLVSIKLSQNSIFVIKKINTRASNQVYGLTRTLINNMVIGVSEKFEKRLILEGVGYRAQVLKKDLVLNLGYSHTINLSIPLGIDVEIEKNGTLIIRGFDKELVGQFSATIKSKRPPEPYKGKGILYQGEILNRKIGKSGK
uniref:50S ribosomal protein L6 n=1 Tax=Dictyotopsis propagulifera TaxID=670095 RepID=UPI002E7661E1|nr:50S ribosomal protein L6 [Dictyotopsis propagulifera]WAM63141.1 50S ribosomal protein L6 [Dictyotopsis propagulifera]